jgi:hypothetical protein
MTGPASKVPVTACHWQCASLTLLWQVKGDDPLPISERGSEAVEAAEVATRRSQRQSGGGGPSGRVVETEGGVCVCGSDGSSSSCGGRVGGRDGCGAGGRALAAAAAAAATVAAQSAAAHDIAAETEQAVKGAATAQAGADLSQDQLWRMAATGAWVAEAAAAAD